MLTSKYSTGLEGKRFNRTVVQSFSHRRNVGNHYQYYWICLCDCGTQHVANARAMCRGKIQSCGCLQREKLGLRTTHGHTTSRHSTREYNSWKRLKARCDHPGDRWFYLYGGRGIKYCEALKSFEYFLRLLGPRPESHTIDRIDSDGHYSCGKCAECLANGWPMNMRWASIDEQNANRRNTVMLTFRGRRQPLMLWAKEFRISRVTLYREYKKSRTSAVRFLEAMGH